MNIQSEIDFFTDLGRVDQARFVTRLLVEIHEEAKASAGRANELSCLKFVNEMTQRLARYAYQLIDQDPGRPTEDVMVRMLLGARTDKSTEYLMHSAYRRALSSFETFDTTVLLNGPP